MAYKAPVWEDGNSPAISAENLNNISQTLEGAQVLWGNVPPTSATEGAVGQFYLVVIADSLGNYPLYQCVGISGNTYTWKKAVVQADAVTISDSLATLLGIPPGSTLADAISALEGLVSNAESQTIGRYIYVEITASRTWVAPSNIVGNKVTVICVGGGGGGAYGKGGGGGSGYITKKDVTVVPGQSYTITIGAGGSRGTSSSSRNGGNGGTTSFGSLVSANGGYGANGGNGGNGEAGGGCGSSGTGGNGNVYGGGGGGGGKGGTYGGGGGSGGTGGTYGGNYNQNGTPANFPTALYPFHMTTSGLSGGNASEFYDTGGGGGYGGNGGAQTQGGGGGYGGNGGDVVGSSGGGGGGGFGGDGGKSYTYSGGGGGGYGPYDIGSSPSSAGGTGKGYGGGGGGGGDSNAGTSGIHGACILMYYVEGDD